MNRTQVLLLFGGESSEHEVSIFSARNVYAAIDDTKFDVLLGYIDRRGKWWLLDKFDTESEVDTDDAPQLIPVLGGGGFITLPENRAIRPDIILPVLHGKNGEDGSVQGLAQLLHIPMVGCDMTASAICMDKVATKEVLSQNNIEVVPYVAHHTGEEAPEFNQLSMRLGSPLFVKPARAGSSVGVSRVHSEEELARALEAAYQHDATALIERGISGRELEVSVLGNPPHHQISGVGEIKLGDDFYSYDEKYSDASDARVIVPADLDPEVAERIRTMAGKAYAALGCRGLARVDFFLAEDGTVYVNELNTLPGFTNISMYPKLWREEGTSYSQLIEKLIEAAFEAFEKEK